MLGKESYRRSRENKQMNYEKSGVSEATGNLIITKDGLGGTEIEKKVKSWLHS